MSKDGKRFYAFGDFQIDPDDRLLLRNREVVPLTPKAAETLIVLIENRGHVVETDELMNKVWGADTFIEKGGVARIISVLRRALGEGPDDSRYIETIPKRGYRFVAEVKEVYGEGVVAPPEPIPPAPPPDSRKRNRTAWILGTALAAVAAVALWLWLSRRPGDIRTLVVLPLENLSKDSAQEYFADGMTDAILTKLARIGALKVFLTRRRSTRRLARRPPKWRGN